MSTRDDETPRGGIHRRPPLHAVPPPPGDDPPAAPRLSRAQRNSSRPMWNGTAKGIVVGLVVALVGGLVFTGVPAIFSQARDGDVRDAVQDEQIEQMKGDIQEIKTIVTRIEKKVDK